MKAVLFDLDGTLLDLDMESFLGRYFRELGAACSHLLADGDFLTALIASTQAMGSEHPGSSNAEVFWGDFTRRTGIEKSLWDPVVGAFYDERFPALGDDCGPKPGAEEAVRAASRLGLKVSVATNPIFPERAVRHRMSWAGIDELSFDLVTTYEIMHACKPAPAFYLEAAELLGVPPVECLMVGDDAVLDMAAAAVGMKTYYVGAEEIVEADLRGDLRALAALLPSLAAESA